MPSAARQLACRAAALLLVPLFGCTATLDNDDSGTGGDGNDRWYTAGARFERPAVGADDGSLAALVDGLVLGVAEVLPLSRDEPKVVTSSGVLGLQMYTPEDTATSAPIPDDRPYAGWLYAGVVRRETTLDPDPLERRDTQGVVELDLGWVGPATQLDDLQKALHNVFGMDEPEGWDNQLDDEPGLVLRAALYHRLGYGETGSGLAWDLIPRADAALGNIDVHAGVGSLARAGFNLSRAFDAVVPEWPPRHDPPASVYVFADLDGRYVVHNLFLEGNTFEDSLSVDEEPYVREFSFGLAWEKGPWRVAWARHNRSEEFDGQREGQDFGSITVSWTPAP